MTYLQDEAEVSGGSVSLFVAAGPVDVHIFKSDQAAEVDRWLVGV